MDFSKARGAVLIVSITPYFLEKGNVWFEENLKKVLQARQTQAFFQDNTLFLEKDQQYSVSELLRKLDELGYEKVLHIESIGEFSTRGGTIEVFPINSIHALRFEFIGNRIDNIEQLDLAIEDETKAKEVLKKRLKSQSASWRTDLKNLKTGDYLVHLDHGIARFTGYSVFDNIHNFHDRENYGRKYYKLEYAQGDRLFVPVELERKLSRYVGFVDPKILRLTSPLWQKTKRKAKEEIEKLARELLGMFAKREISFRPAYGPEDDIEKKIIQSFSFKETPDQIQALQDIYDDLAQTKPMDRIICGDVGFGKTEVALRTMVRVVQNGYQTVLLAPTTILAYQHYQNFQSRMKDTPIRAAMISRLQSKKQQQEVLHDLRHGHIDMIIGTHRLLSNDVQFHNLGLLVIDDEQRFGVKQKEKFKELHSSLDILSLSATPIPRTLYMALSSLKSISTIQTPPEGRLPVKIIISQRKEKVIKEAIETEIKRKGQIYYLHNRVGTIEGVKKYLEKLMPSANYGVAHGRLKETELIRIMDDFRQKKFDVLLATTIIENGLDLANVSTIIIEDATRLGLAQAYQIKGRVGRSNIQSYAYFLYGGRLSPKAKLRLKALKEAEELGSGYRIAMKDLEIRGAGNILGKEQAGTVNAIGLNLYCQMLAESVEKLKTVIQ